jgi:hypothetical protein
VQQPLFSRGQKRVLWGYCTYPPYCAPPKTGAFRLPFPPTRAENAHMAIGRARLAMAQGVSVWVLEAPGGFGDAQLQLTTRSRSPSACPYCGETCNNPFSHRQRLS